MDNLEKARAEAEARQSERRMSSADRSRFWAGLNRYLKAEAVHEHHVAEREQEESGDASPEPTDDR